MGYTEVITDDKEDSRMRVFSFFIQCVSVKIRTEMFLLAV